MKKKKLPLTTERHYSGSRPFRGHTERRHSGSKDRKVSNYLATKQCSVLGFFNYSKSTYQITATQKVLNLCEDLLMCY